MSAAKLPILPPNILDSLVFDPRPPLLLLYVVADCELSPLTENRFDVREPPLFTNARAACREFPPPNGIEFIVPPLIGDITPWGISGRFFPGEIAIANA